MQRNKRGQIKPHAPEDIFMMQNIQPACHSSHVRNNYFLAVRCTYEGCTCCAALPHSRIPLNIIPINNPQCFYQVPQGW